MGRVFLGPERAIGSLHQEAFGLRLLQELGDFAFGNGGIKLERLGVRRFHSVAQFGEGFEEGGAESHFLLPPFVDGAREPLQAGNPGLMFAGPFVKCVGVELMHVLADLGLAQLLLFGIGRLANHFRDEGHRTGDLELIERQALRIEIIEGQFAIGMNQNRRAAQTLGEFFVGKPPPQ